MRDAVDYDDAVLRWIERFDFVADLHNRTCVHGIEVECGGMNFTFGNRSCVEIGSMFRIHIRDAFLFESGEIFAKQQSGETFA